MFWIPVATVALSVWLVYGIINGVKKNKYNAEEAIRKGEFEEFCAFTSPGRELSWKARRYANGKSLKECEDIVEEFVGDHRLDWRFLGFPRFVEAIYLAKHGKLTVGLRSSNVPVYIDDVPPWERIEMYERFLLRLEKELNANGAHVTLVANYGPSSYGSVSKYYRVKQWISKYGYAKNKFVSFGTDFSWIGYVDKRKVYKIQ